MLTGTDAELAAIVAKELAFINRATQMMMARVTVRRGEATRGEPEFQDIEAQYTVNVNDNDNDNGDDNGDVNGDNDMIYNMSERFVALCAFIEVDVSEVDAMTTPDQPITDASLTRQRHSNAIVVSGIVAAFKKRGAVRVVDQLHDMASRVWNRMAYMAHYRTLLN
jgi:hypothetical protein